MSALSYAGIGVLDGERRRQRGGTARAGLEARVAVLEAEVAILKGAGAGAGPSPLLPTPTPVPVPAPAPVPTPAPIPAPIPAAPAVTAPLLASWKGYYQQKIRGLTRQIAYYETAQPGSAFLATLRSQLARYQGALSAGTPGISGLGWLGASQRSTGETLAMAALGFGALALLFTRTPASVL